MEGSALLSLSGRISSTDTGALLLLLLSIDLEQLNLFSQVLEFNHRQIEKD